MKPLDKRVKTPPTGTPLVCLLTDFGLADHYVGVMKAVLLSKSPGVQIIDLTHAIPPQSVRQAAYHLLVSYRYHPKDTFFLCVVDPGVGSSRKILYVEAGRWRFIAPDNGLLSWVLDQEPPKRIVDVTHAPDLDAHVSPTFHGRDVIAPVAARILNGEDPVTLGPDVKDIVRMPFPLVEKWGAMWKGEVLTVDSFGNLITNFRLSEVLPLASAAKLWIELETHQTTIRGLSEAYASVRPGKLLAIEGSGGFIEISVRDGSAAAATKMQVGSRVTLHFRT